jgi:hypothetical protein
VLRLYDAAFESSSAHASCGAHYLSGVVCLVHLHACLYHYINLLQRLETEMPPSFCASCVAS